MSQFCTGRWLWRLLMALLVLAAPLAQRGLAQTTSAPIAAASIRGAVTTQEKTIPLAGVAVALTADGREVATAVTEGDGTFTFPSVAPGVYALVVVAQGFEPLATSVTVGVGQQVAATLDLKIAAVSETVDVVAPMSVVSSTGTLTSSEGLTSRQLEELGGVSGLQSALRLLVSVIEVPGGVSIKGGRPNQATVQLGPGAFVDPSTGLSQVTLPDDAIDKVTVLPNPYAVEYGRFSSGLVLIQTRRATDVWRTRVNKLEPSFRTGRGEPFNIVGVAAFSPRFETGGPLIKDKLFVKQAAQYRYRTSDVPSRPQSELKVSNLFSSFTRVDANLSARHSLIGAVGLFPGTTKRATLGTFTPPDAAIDMEANVTTASVTERSLWNDTLFSETTVEVHNYHTAVTPRGAETMELLPETTLGNFFNRQRRNTDTYQFIETISGSLQNADGWLQLFKAGVDVLHNRYGGTSASTPVLIRRSDGTLARRLAFTASSTTQSVVSTDLALFVQDRVQPNNRFYVELGARLDRDGVLGRLNVTPRVGAALLLNASGSSVVRGGLGIFYERTPSAAGAFKDFEGVIDTRYAADGVTPSGPPVRFDHATSSSLRTSRSATWDLVFDHRFNQKWATHLGAIHRAGSNELLVESRTVPAPQLLLNSNGQSRYREVEVGVHFTGGPGLDINASYVRSQTRADLNAFTSFYDNVLWPVVARNEYAPARTDTPHRLLLRGRATPVRNWLIIGTLDWRTGLPYSVVNETLDFVGSRNERRFPTYFRTDLGIEHRIKLGKLRPWVGVRADNALSSFLPSDVQANVSSPAFGTFYNSEYRLFRIQFRFEP